MDDYPQLIDAAVRAFRARLEAQAEAMGEARSPAEFCKAERQVHALALELAADITQRVVQRISDDPERGKLALAKVRERAASRGIKLRVERRRDTQIRTLGGQVIRVTTPYASARPKGGRRQGRRGAGGTGVYPVLDELGVIGRSTPALRLRVSHAVCEANSVAAARELLAAGGVEIGHKAALRLTYLVTEDALKAREEAVKRQIVAAEEGPFAGRCVVVTVDGGRINIRRRIGGRPKSGGRKRFTTEWREPKVLTLYVLNEDGKRDRSIPSVIDGTLGDADAVYDLMLYHLRRLGGAKAAKIVLIGDGAPWIWNRGQRLRRDLGVAKDAFVEIVDYFHVVERLGAFATSRPTWSAEFRHEWLMVQKARLKAGEIEDLEAVYRVIDDLEPEVSDAEHAYWKRNRERLRYAQFRQQGLPIGSGAVESSVRRVINLRLKGASITWTERHAEGVLHLRAHAKSGRWDELEQAVLSRTGWRPTARQPSRAA